MFVAHSLVVFLFVAKTTSIPSEMYKSGLSFRTCSGNPGTFFFRKIEFSGKSLEFFGKILEFLGKFLVF